MRRIKKKFGIVVLTVITAFSAININSYDVEAINYLSAIKTVAWKIASFGATYYFNREPMIKEGPNWVESSTGTQYFNHDIGSSVKVRINLGKSNMQLDCFAQTVWTNWLFGKISVILLSPDGSETLIDRSVTHNQHSYYSTSAPYGTYTLLFVEGDSAKWDCFYTLYDYNYSSSTESNYFSIDSFSDVSGTNGIVSGVVDNSSGKSYFKRSDDLQAKDNKINIHKSINMEELNEECYDDKLEMYVNVMKSYSIGDTVLFSDVISDIEYNVINDYTVIYFDTPEGTIGWPFSGDLRTDFMNGDTLDLQFGVVEEFSSNSISFSNLDYILDGTKLEESNKYPDIEKYLK